MKRFFSLLICLLTWYASSQPPLVAYEYAEERNPGTEYLAFYTPDFQLRLKYWFLELDGDFTGDEFAIEGTEIDLDDFAEVNDLVDEPAQFQFVYTWNGTNSLDLELWRAENVGRRTLAAGITYNGLFFATGETVRFRVRTAYYHLRYLHSIFFTFAPDFRHTLELRFGGGIRWMRWRDSLNTVEPVVVPAQQEESTYMRTAFLGFHARASLWERVKVEAGIDFGPRFLTLRTGDSDMETSMNDLYLEAGYQFLPAVSLRLGYRVLMIDHEDDEKNFGGLNGGADEVDADAEGIYAVLTWDF